jgi:hypothetical protein
MGKERLEWAGGKRATVCGMKKQAASASLQYKGDSEIVMVVIASLAMARVHSEAAYFAIVG